MRFFYYHYRPRWPDHAWSTVLTSFVTHFNTDTFNKVLKTEKKMVKESSILQKLAGSYRRRDLCRLHDGDFRVCERLEDKVDLLWMTVWFHRGMGYWAAKGQCLLIRVRTCGGQIPSLQPCMGGRNTNHETTCFLAFFEEYIEKNSLTVVFHLVSRLVNCRPYSLDLL